MMSKMHNKLRLVLDQYHKYLTNQPNSPLIISLNSITSQKKLAIYKAWNKPKEVEKWRSKLL